MEINFEDRVRDALLKAKKFIENLTVDSSENLPGLIVTSGDRFFSWDMEHRSKENGQNYLYSWSYYNGVVFEGLKYIFEGTGDEKYLTYIKDYLESMITDDMLNEHAGYVLYHGLDCYKSASLLEDYCDLNMNGALGGSGHCKVCERLYNDLVILNADYTEEVIGGNYWHKWYNSEAPKYKVWLDGIYMAQPFLAKHAWKVHDKEQLEKIYKRFRWVADNMVAENGLYYHAANNKDDYCAFFWLRAIGWYAMAQVDVMEYMCGDHLDEMKKDLKKFIDNMLRFQDESGMWRNIVDRPLSEMNRTETSGTAMIIYCILKAIRMGWIVDQKGIYIYAALKAFCCMTEQKLKDNKLKDIYLVASATGNNNYERLDLYKVNEGKGIGPYIMAYAEMIKADRLFENVHVHIFKGK